jgi:hypothetical protein
MVQRVKPVRARDQKHRAVKHLVVNQEVIKHFI